MKADLERRLDVLADDWKRDMVGPNVAALDDKLENLFVGLTANWLQRRDDGERLDIQYK